MIIFMSRTCSLITTINVLTPNLKQVTVYVCECVFMTFEAFTLNTHIHTRWVPLGMWGTLKCFINGQFTGQTLIKQQVVPVSVNLNWTECQFKFAINIKGSAMSEF